MLEIQILLIFIRRSRQVQFTLGIGKSSALAALICYLQDEKTRPEMQKCFPFLKDFDNYIFIDGDSLLDQKEMQIIAEILKKENYLIVIDDAHLLLKLEKKDKFIDKLRGNKFVIYLSSQRANKKDIALKNETKSAFLSELPHVDAVLNLTDALLKEPIEEQLPPLQREYFAHLLWFYSGGNFRMLPDFLEGDYHSYADIFWKTSWEVQEEKTVKDPQSDQTKKAWFQKAYQYLENNYAMTLDEMVDLEFGISKGKEKRKLSQDQSNIEDRKLKELIGNNIIVLKEIHIQPNKKRTKTPCFHSRRTQYSFARFMLQLDSHWENRGDERIRYQWLLERIRYKHILDFEVYLLKKKINEETIHQLTLERENTSDQKELEQIRKELKELTEQRQRLMPVLKLMEAENKLIMLYFEAYQLSLPQQFDPVEHFTVGANMRELRKGPKSFYRSNSSQIEKGKGGREGLKEEIEAMEIKIQEMKNKESVLRERAVFQKEIAEKFCQEFKNLLENKAQGKWEIIADGVIEKDILETFNPKDEKNREKIENVVEKARINEKAITREICNVEEEGAVAQLEKWIEQKPFAEKKGEKGGDGKDKVKGSS